MIIEVIFALAYLLVAVIFHEAGHYYTARQYDLKPKLNLKRVKDFPFYDLYVEFRSADGTTTVHVLLIGIMAGLLPIGVLMLQDKGLGVAILLAYLSACYSDMKLIARQ